MTKGQEWFKNARLGMFIHWGAYSVAARGEWVLNRELIPYEEYNEKYVNNFKAENFNPREWAKLAKEFGAQYIVFTTRHHDGFSLWDTKVSDYNSVKMGPKKDLVREFVDAVRAEGLRVGFYYSYADWSHPDYPGSYARDWYLDTDWKSEEANKRFIEYYHAQLKELMTNYGKIDILWYDGGAPGPTDGTTINKYVKELQPDILINNRNCEPFDFTTSEQKISVDKDKMIESCMTLNSNWAYHAGDYDYKTPHQVIKMIGEITKGGGNLLLNVGPMADGTVPQESVDIIREVGKWVHTNGEAIYGSEPSPYTWSNSFVLTTKDNNVYVHLYYYTGEELCVPDIKNKVLSISLLHNGKELSFRQEGARLFIALSQDDFKAVTTPVIKIQVEGKPEATAIQKNFWIID